MRNRTTGTNGTEHDQQEAVRQRPSTRFPASASASSSAARTLALQRVVGNRAVGELLGEGHAPVQRRPAGGRPVQRAKLNIRPMATTAYPAGTISGVSQFPNRPTSNLRGTQGQHLTAYVVFEDTIRNRLTNRTPQQAAEELGAYLDEIGELPGMQQANARYLDSHINASRTLLAAAARSSDDDDAAKVVQEEIDRILSIRNQIPGTAERGVGGGHGEANQAGITTEVEKSLRDGQPFKPAWTAVEDQVRRAMWRLLDYNPSMTVTDDKAVTVLVTHYQSLRSAYPHTFAWLTDKGEYLYDYLTDQPATDVDMPLGTWRSAGKNLAPLFDQVYAAL